FFFSHHTPTPEIYTLSLHDALPIYYEPPGHSARGWEEDVMEALARNWWALVLRGIAGVIFGVLTFMFPAMTLAVLILLFGAYARSEEHTSELQSLAYLVCRLLLEKK